MWIGEGDLFSMLHFYFIYDSIFILFMYFSVF